MSAIENDIKPSDKFAMEAQLEKDFSVLHTPSSLKELVKKKRGELNVLNKEEEILKKKCLAKATL